MTANERRYLHREPTWYELGDHVTIRHYGILAVVTSKTYGDNIRYEVRCLTNGAYLRDLPAADLCLKEELL